MDCACIGEDRLRMVAGTALVDRVLALTGSATASRSRA
jgi:hypothetical protein